MQGVSKMERCTWGGQAGGGRATAASADVIGHDGVAGSLTNTLCMFWHCSGKLAGRARWSRAADRRKTRTGRGRGLPEHAIISRGVCALTTSFRRAGGLEGRWGARSLQLEVRPTLANKVEESARLAPGRVGQRMHEGRAHSAPPGHGDVAIRAAQP